MLNQSRIQSIHDRSQDFVIESKFNNLINPSTLSLDTLKFLGTLVEDFQPLNILEFGSGLSTLFLCNLLKKQGDGHLFSIENSAQYYKATQKMTKYATNLSLFLCPITRYWFKGKQFSTYEKYFVDELPAVNFDMVLIDGPLSYKYGREAPLYQVLPFLNTETLILLDDALRKPEQEAISNWKHVWSKKMDVLEFSKLKKGFAMIMIGNPSHINRYPFSISQILRSNFCSGQTW